MRVPKRECPFCGLEYVVGDKNGYQMYANHLENHAENDCHMVNAPSWEIATIQGLLDEPRTDKDINKAQGILRKYR